MPPPITIEAARLALAQLPRGRLCQVLIRGDSGGGIHEFLAWLARPGRRLAYFVGFTITGDIADSILHIPARAWTPPMTVLIRADTGGGTHDS